MVGIFSRFSRTGHRRAQSALDERQVLPPDAEIASSAAAAAAAASHGIEISVQFKPVEHPIEPLDNAQPVKCPLPEPSILNDGRIWKERLSTSVPRMPDLPVMKGRAHLETEAAGTKTHRNPVSRSSLPSSISAPEHNFINLLDECKAAGD
ncbi:ATP-dependent RNA helicase Dbp73D isoform 1 [Cinnamomum micranthum f. kanehirae]|uniref:ATP-dependent RNA helicase Dbp73D isoform 1 n=1 Tax=Cinnamomum micranthum f. kanehirae TaxID=337451 RepID=A0A3S3N5A0_9MAGN|nr:ATP-dependent RNA helicase Dbp73D isoform 1 [Cinnamomum micranthum f. kanehirae]